MKGPGIPPDVTVHLVTMEIDVVRQVIFSRAVVNTLSMEFFSSEAL